MYRSRSLMAACAIFASRSPSDAIWSILLRRAPTSANSAATKNAFARTRMITAPRRHMYAPMLRCSAFSTRKQPPPQIVQIVAECHSAAEVYSLAVCNAPTRHPLRSFPSDDQRRTAMLDPLRILRWVYVGRLTMSAAIFLAAVLAWRNADAGLTLIASLLITVALAFTAGSAFYSVMNRASLRPAFLYIQSLFDLVVVTAIVHVTGGGTSQFAALYILVIAAAALLLPFSGGLVVAALGCILYFADVILSSGTQLDLGVWLQLGVFAAVALGSGYIAARLRQAGAGTEQLAAALVKVRLQAADILKNIRSGIITVDASGGLVYANPAASQLLGIDLDAHVGTPVIGTIAAAAPALARALERAAQDGTRTTRAEGTITDGDRQFPIGLNTTSSEGQAGVAATATA